VEVSVRIDRVHRRPDEVRAPGEPWRGIERVVVARDDRLGDVVLSLPAVAALRATYPRATLALLVRPRIAPLARIVDGVDEVLAPEHGGIARSLERFRPDLLVCISRRAALAFAARRAGVPHTVGTGRRWWSWLFERRVHESRRAGRRHEAEYALSFAHRAGAAPTSEHAVRLRIPQDALDAARDFGRGIGPFALLHPGSGGSCPGWPRAHWLALAPLLVERGLGVALSIGPDDAEVGAAFAGGSASVARLPRVAPGLVALAAAAREAAVVVGASSGPIHLAAAVGAKTVAIHAPWPSCAPERWGPWAENGWAITPQRAGMRWSRAERRTSGRTVLAAVSPELVAAVVADVARGVDPRRLASHPSTACDRVSRRSGT
jgi:ADP-heptose:LPS heptosyltransferase